MPLVREIRIALLLAALLSMGAFAARSASARACGGGIPCACGDKVVASAVLSADIGVCTGSGLLVASGVTLDCAGHLITGNNSSNARFGIHVDRVKNATVRNCRVTGFRRGLRINGGSANALIGNETFLNKYGIDLAGSTAGNTLESNLVRDNSDEGAHLGGANGNRIAANEFRYNKRENLYLLRSNGNQVVNNLVHHSKQSAIYVKHSDDNTFVHNEVRDTALELRGDSNGNVFVDNYLKGNGYMLQAYQEPSGWTFPHDNTMTGDCIRKTDFCYRFLGAYDNHATQARTDGRCQPPMIATPLGGNAAVDNTVDLLPNGCNDDPW